MSISHARLAGARHGLDGVLIELEAEAQEQTLRGVVARGEILIVKAGEVVAEAQPYVGARVSPCTRPCTDSAITNFQITLNGSMNAKTGATAPSFTLSFNVVIK